MQQIIPAAFSMSNATAAVPAEHDDGNMLTLDDVRKREAEASSQPISSTWSRAIAPFSRQPAEWADADVESAQAVDVRNNIGAVATSATSSAAAPTESANVPGVNAAEGTNWSASQGRVQPPRGDISQSLPLTHLPLAPRPLTRPRVTGPARRRAWVRAGALRAGGTKGADGSGPMRGRGRLSIHHSRATLRLNKKIPVSQYRLSSVSPCPAPHIGGTPARVRARGRLAHSNAPASG